MARQYYVYFLSNDSRMLYVGVTGDIERRMSEHKRKLIDGYTKRYNLTRLVYYEAYHWVPDAIAREKQLKGWLRHKKVDLIESGNPTWGDLGAE